MNIPFPNSRKTPAFIVCCLLSIAILGYIYLDGISILIRQWLRLDEYWRFLIIPVSVYFVWIKRKELPTLSVRPNFLFGIPLIIMGCIAYFLWKISLVDFFIETGLFVLSFGCIFLFIGARFARFFIFPLFYLVFMTSILVRILSSFTIVLQHLSAIVASFFLNAIGWPVLRDGLFLRLPHLILEVAPACSGTNQLIALVAFALPLGVLRHESFWSRALLVAMTIPITLFSNAVRIVLIALWNYNGQQSYIHGPHGILDLPLVYPLALVCLYGFSLFLTCFEKKNVTLPSRQPGDSNHHLRPASIHAAWYIGCLLAVMTLAAISYFRAKPAVFEYSLNDFPMHINGWTGEEHSGTPISFYMGKPEASIQKKFRDEHGMSVLLTIARFDRQNTRSRISSLAWKNFTGQECPIDIAINDHMSIYALKTVAVDADRTETIVSWFDVDGATCRNVEQMRKKLIVNTLKKKRNNAAFIAMSFSDGPGQVDDSIARSFAAAMAPKISKFLSVTP